MNCRENTERKLVKFPKASGFFFHISEAGDTQERSLSVHSQFYRGRKGIGKANIKNCRRSIPNGGFLHI